MRFHSLEDQYEQQITNINPSYPSSVLLLPFLLALLPTLCYSQFFDGGFFGQQQQQQAPPPLDLRALYDAGRYSFPSPSSLLPIRADPLSRRISPEPCSQYLCPGSLKCLPSPAECPCPFVQDFKCPVGPASEGAYVCARDCQTVRKALLLKGGAGK